MPAAPGVCWGSRLSGSTYLSDNHDPLRGAGESFPVLFEHLPFQGWEMNYPCSIGGIS